MKRMIYYYPAPILETSSSASGIRPRKMLEAFRNIGYDVDVVSGYTKERKQKIDKVRENVKNGVIYDFAYGEDTTLPFAMNDPSHIPFAPFMDYIFWWWMKKRNIPFGCFYRDMYWRFPEYRKGLAFHKWAAPLPFHYCDVFMLKRLSRCIFFPSVQCAKDLPFHVADSQIFALPPGCECEAINTKSTDNKNVIWNRDNPLKLFYVGGILPPSYDISTIVNFTARMSLPVQLTICCREKEFQKVLADGIYKNINSPTIKMVHKPNDELKPYWSEADVFIVLRQKARYLKNAMPFKIYESIGWGLPIIISNGSAAADMVKENDFGWAIEPREEYLHNVLLSVISNPSILKDKQAKILNRRDEFTWEARARFVRDVLISNQR